MRRRRQHVRRRMISSGGRTVRHRARGCAPGIGSRPGLRATLNADVGKDESEERTARAPDWGRSPIRCSMRNSNGLQSAVRSSQRAFWRSGGGEFLYQNGCASTTKDILTATLHSRQHRVSAAGMTVGTTSLLLSRIAGNSRSIFPDLEQYLFEDVAIQQQVH